MPLYPVQPIPCHIPAIAHELGLEIDADTFDRMQQGAHYLLDIRPAGKMACTVLLLCRRCSRCDGGNKVHAAPGCDDRYRERTLGENLEELKASGFYDKCDGISEKVGAEAHRCYRSGPLRNPSGQQTGPWAILRQPGAGGFRW